uniref:Uncharacterized protein n=1 Tax=Siphoviridae sp. ctZd434 TaxID=2825559 RepID=A0A8S5UHD4_9CAUD|nr:MAG TPA: hypothetical protein [Siphoviridae sp. ctZd434]
MYSYEINQTLESKSYNFDSETYIKDIQKKGNKKT